MPADGSKYADLLPGRLHRVLLGSVRPEKLLRGLDGGICGYGECRGGTQFIAECVVPNLACFFPGMAAKSSRDQIEGMVRYPGVDVHASAVIGALVVVFHIVRLRILAELWIII